MKRSEINRELIWAKRLLDSRGIKLPPFGYWTMEDWEGKVTLTGKIRKVMLGWDITDYGQGEFNRLGAVLFTLRNGSVQDDSMGTPYAEKLIMLKDGQRLPLHHHASKTEDIINRSGGVLAIRLYNNLPGGGVDRTGNVSVELDGIVHVVRAGEELNLHPGESITLRPFVNHLFWAKKGAGDLICGEVSSINDDNKDNYNAEDVSRFSTVEEDEGILHPLCNEYDRLF